MGRDWMVCWRWEEFPHSVEITGRMVSYAGSKQFDRVASGDTLWLVIIPKDRGRSTGKLTLLGRLNVERILTVERAIDLLGADHILTDRPYHAVAKPGTEMPYEDIPLAPIARDLRFQSDNDRLDVASDGFVDGKQLQSIRLLTPGSVALLQRRMEEYREGRRNARERLAKKQRNEDEGAS